MTVCCGCSREAASPPLQSAEAVAVYAALSRRQYEAGTVNYLQVLDAERSLFSAQLARVRTLASLLASYVDVYKSMGGRWVDEAERGQQ